MNRYLSLCVAACAMVSLGGCATRFGRALVPSLPPVEVGIKPAMHCSDLAAKVKAASDKALTSEQLIALYGACEQMQDGQKVPLDPDGARKSLALGSLVGP